MCSFFGGGLNFLKTQFVTYRNFLSLLVNANDSDLKDLMSFKDHSCLQGKQQGLVIISQVLL